MLTSEPSLTMDSRLPDLRQRYETFIRSVQAVLDQGRSALAPGHEKLAKLHRALSEFFQETLGAQLGAYATWQRLGNRLHKDQFTFWQWHFGASARLIEQLRGALASVNAALLRLKDELEPLETMRLQYVAQRAALEAANLTLREQFNQAQADYTAVQTQRAQLEQDNHALTSQLQAAQATAEALADNPRTVEHIRALHEQLSQQSQGMTALADDHERLRQQHDGLQQENHTAEARVAELEAEKAGLEAACERLESEVAQLQTDNAGLQKLNAELAQHIQQLNHQVAEQAQQIKTIREEQAQQTQQAASFQQQFDTLNQQLDELTQRFNQKATTNAKKGKVAHPFFSSPLGSRKSVYKPKGGTRKDRDSEMKQGLLLETRIN